MFGKFLSISLLSLSLSHAAFADSKVSELCYDMKTDYGFCIVQVQEEGTSNFYVRQKDADTAMLYAPLASKNITAQSISERTFEFIRQLRDETITYEIAEHLKTISAHGNMRDRSCNSALFDNDSYSNNICSDVVNEVVAHMTNSNGGATSATVQDKNNQDRVKAIGEAVKQEICNDRPAGSEPIREANGDYGYHGR